MLNFSQKNILIFNSTNLAQEMGCQAFTKGVATLIFNLCCKIDHHKMFLYKSNNFLFYDLCSFHSIISLTFHSFFNFTL